MIIIFLILGVLSGCSASYKLVTASLKKSLEEDRLLQEQEKKGAQAERRKVHAPKIASRVFKEKKDE